MVNSEAFSKVRKGVLIVSLGMFMTMSAWAQQGWQQISAETDSLWATMMDGFLDRDGIWRTPSCSGGPTPAGEAIVPANTDYSFFLREGNPNRLAIFWSGGGACWDPNTCIGTALVDGPLYAMEVTMTTEIGDTAGGLFDLDDDRNPLHTYTQVFIPYCTGDLHTGASDTEYFYETSDGASLTWTIHHRGYDNVVAVLEWLGDYYANHVGRMPKEVFLTGSSAGSLGMLYAYPAVHQMFPNRTKIRVLCDSGPSVTTQDFHDRALAPDGVWNTWANLSPSLADAFSVGSDDFAVELIRSLGSRYSRTRFGEYARAFDFVATLYYNVTKHVDWPEFWTDQSEILIAAVEWTNMTRSNLKLSALAAANYRYYLGAGTAHTITASDSLYTESSAQGIDFCDWLDDMINARVRKSSNWQNVGCEPNCL